jgi:A/G-specific adenine glycosylase
VSLPRSENPNPKRDSTIVRALCQWFVANARDLPWRQTTNTGKRDPYRSLVSEIMLQQTQVSRVLEKFEPFLDEFPTLESLAEAEEDEVLTMWSGLGYYRRARSLHACAQQATEEFGGLPESVADLEKLKGIGRYTAGAIASIVHNHAEPIVDGNVERVLLRLEGQELRAGETQTKNWCWDRASELVLKTERSKSESVNPATFNEGLMELGALVCTPKSPSCHECPFSGSCVANRESKQDSIPLPKTRKAKKPLYMACLLVRDSKSRLLISQRPKGGLWGGLWQVPTLESDTRLLKTDLAKHFSVATKALIREDSFVHETTHRSVAVVVYRLAAPSDMVHGTWIANDDTSGLATGSLQDRVIRAGFGIDIC